MRRTATFGRRVEVTKPLTDIVEADFAKELKEIELKAA
jgi:hypothetical protein